MSFSHQLKVLEDALNDPESSRTLLGGMLKRLVEAHDSEIATQHKLVSERSGQLDAERRASSDLRDHLANLKSGNSLQKLWRSVDGERIIEAAYAHDPKGVTIALNTLGGSMIACELRDRKLMKGECMAAEPQDGLDGPCVC